MLGSIAHRAGLGLDVSYAGTTDNTVQFNRVALSNPKAAATATVSPQEKALYAEYKTATLDREKADADVKLVLARHAVGSANTESSSIQQEVAAANDRAKAALAAEKMAEKRWKKEVPNNQPRLVSSLRDHLCSDSSVVQLFDPWYMDANTKDAVPPEINQQRSGNEKLHANHLHITVQEPKLL
jgi:hypothetical protein